MSVDIVENVDPHCRLKTDEQAEVTRHSILTKICRTNLQMSRPGRAKGRTMLLLTVRLLLIIDYL